MKIVWVVFSIWQLIQPGEPKVKFDDRLTNPRPSHLFVNVDVWGRGVANKAGNYSYCSLHISTHIVPLLNGSPSSITNLSCISFDLIQLKYLFYWITRRVLQKCYSECPFQKKKNLVFKVFSIMKLWKIMMFWKSTLVFLTSYLDLKRWSGLLLF